MPYSKRMSNETEAAVDSEVAQTKYRLLLPLYTKNKRDDVRESIKEMNFAANHAERLWIFDSPLRITTAAGMQTMHISPSTSRDRIAPQLVWYHVNECRKSLRFGVQHHNSADL